ncbi:MAG: type II toxin-antitoxin system YafQ family toxin [Muribaculaceae bacterium]|nr:type II toxin-antitoxin system YafQ family toxin [Muribaculaceae bacterium]MBQ5409659.1 type II toxin-antitoxin system YafQ family toxin [Muribaculaceae bacterium]MBQ5508548.1 type II toxin-antitoxin system YafQ family toxin [Muribaculaceae bacterium]MDY6292782.1 type II toxin-antitoxin system YafQ family toxin [Bacteroidales bacterium]MDY6412829.1 type II toxin-antitoxin system YafQ family toxin [Bacteroidales bacterium]
MKTLIYSTQFKKDFKKYQNDPKKLRQLYSVLQLLAKGEPVPRSMRPHKLTGNYAGCMECHVGNDFLLIWMDETTMIVRLLRLGKHSELF